MNEFFAETLSIIKVLVYGTWIVLLAIIFIIAPISVISEDWDFYKKLKTCTTAEWHVESSVNQIKSVRDYLDTLSRQFETRYNNLQQEVALSYEALRKEQVTLKIGNAEVKRVCYDTPGLQYIRDYNVVTFYLTPFYLKKVIFAIRYPL